MITGLDASRPEVPTQSRPLLSAKGRHFLFTIDADWIPGSAKGLEILLELCAELSVRATIFATGKFALAYASLIQDACTMGHEIGTHGWQHPFLSENYRLTTKSQRREWLLRATDAIASVIGRRPQSFRAPYLWTDATTFALLEEMGYLVDSSIPTRRFDGMIGVVNYSGYFWAGLDPYYPDRAQPARKGNSPILEVPPSAMLLPLNMSTLRFVGVLPTLWLARLLSRRASILNFYCHPWEFVHAAELEFPEHSPSRHVDGLGPHLLGKLRVFMEAVIRSGHRPATMMEVAACVSPS